MLAFGPKGLKPTPSSDRPPGGLWDPALSRERLSETPHFICRHAAFLLSIPQVIACGKQVETALGFGLIVPK
jgi:hypothetical protein